MGKSTVPLALLMFCASARADVAPIAGTQSVAPVFEKADLVCNCVVRSLRVLSQRELGVTPKIVVRQRVVASVEVNDDYKSITPAARQIFVGFEREIPATRASMPSLESGERAVMFLSSTGPSHYTFADPFLGAVPFHSLPLTAGGQGLEKLEQALRAVLLLTDRDDQIQALELLGGFDQATPGTSSALLSLTHSPDPVVVLSAFVVLLKISGTPDIDQADLLANLKIYLDSYPLGTEPTQLTNIGSELGHIQSDKALAGLEALSDCRYVPIRFGALSAIRNVRSPNSASVLIRHLDDKDGNVRYVAVIALAEIFQKYGDYAPGMGLFDKNPDFYTRLWKDWWVQEGRAQFMFSTQRY